jgi:hypothetical protein
MDTTAVTDFFLVLTAAAAVLGGAYLIVTATMGGWKKLRGMSK